MKIALGTAQFGLNYGIANKKGQVDINSIESILSYAWDMGVDTIDTAISYGSSEKRIGTAGVSNWKIVTKLPEIPDSCTDVSTWVVDQVQDSMLRLNVNKIKGLILHNPNQLLFGVGERLWEALQDLKRNNVVEKIGFSIYDPSELDKLYSSFSPDIVQSTYNVLDHRLKTSGWLQRMNKDGVEVHVRSVFLQGLLLMKNDERPKQFNRWKKIWDEWDSWLSKQDYSAVEACLAFVIKEPLVDKVIVGIDTMDHIREILSSVNVDIPEYPKDLCTNDIDLINPSRWQISL
jgi:aryl-alcohol dehydrogenase-like predicted oxidoreductase